MAVCDLILLDSLHQLGNLLITIDQQLSRFEPWRPDSKGPRCGSSSFAKSDCARDYPDQGGEGANRLGGKGKSLGRVIQDDFSR
jgi:hypothetical protein